MIRTKLDLVKLSGQPEVSQSGGEVRLEESPEEYLVISPRLDTDDHDIIIHAICEHIGYCNHNQLNAGHPYGAMVSTKSLLDGKWDTYAHFFTKVPQRPEGHPYHVKPAGSYAVTYLKGNYYDAADAYGALLDWIRDNRLIPGEFSYKEAVLDEIAAASEEDYITKISIPVEK
ncbi:MAG: hypothetical protein PUG60_14235 [Lachnospiraceae bacterium]|nr:hypothetical protein [Lachnospiraceae bacterium]